MMESFMKTLKHEEINPGEYATADDVIRRLPPFVEERSCKIADGLTPRSATVRPKSSSDFTRHLLHEVKFGTPDFLAG